MTSGVFETWSAFAAQPKRPLQRPTGALPQVVESYGYPASSGQNSIGFAQVLLSSATHGGNGWHSKIGVYRTETLPVLGEM